MKLQGREMKLQKSTSLTEAEKSQVEALIKLCNDHDLTYTEIYLNNQFNYYPDLPAFYLAYEGEALVGFLSVYADEADEAEIKALVLPEKRRQGIFRMLLTAAAEELRKKDYCSVLYIVDHCFSDYEALMLALGGKYEEAEYYMAWQQGEEKANVKPRQDRANLRLATEADILPLAKISAEAFDNAFEVELKYETEALKDPAIRRFVLEHSSGELIGACSVNISPALNYIFGLCVCRSYQHQGFGGQLLREIVASLHKEGREQIALSVVSENENALQLYKNSGFKIKTTNLYYKAELSSIKPKQPLE